MPRSWHGNKPWDQFIGAGEKALVDIYRNGLKELKSILQTVYAEMEKDGIISYKDLSRYGKIDELLLTVKDRVKTLLKQRATIINYNVKRASAAKYHDVLYQAQRLVSARYGVGKKLRVPPDRLEAFLKAEPYKWTKGAASTLSKVKAAITEPLKDGVDLDRWTASLVKAFSSDCGRTIATMHDIGGTLVNEATDICLSSMTDGIKTGIDNLLESYGMSDDLYRPWVHDDPITPRSGHVKMDGQLPDKDGYYTNPETGNKAKYPGGFADDSENYGCKCSIELMTKEEYQARYG